MTIGKVYEIDLGEVEVSFNPSPLNVVMIFSLVSAEKVEGSFHQDAASDHDYNGYEDVEWQLLGAEAFFPDENADYAGDWKDLTDEQVDELDTTCQEKIEQELWRISQTIFSEADAA